MLSILSSIRTKYPDDKFLEDIEKNIKSEKTLTYSQIVQVFQGTKQWVTRDQIAGHQGLQIPPHFHVLAETSTYQLPFIMCANLAKYARRAGSHIESLEKKSVQASRIGTHVFIGHGRSNLWKDFRDFIHDRVRLPWDEFNRVPIAGIPTTTRLMQMLDQAAIAFLILTAEDEQADGKVHPRMNVIHEAGLFQGRLGLEKAILLLEEGCEEFSNVHGLGQIRFPKGNISHVFEEVRRVLEREGLIVTIEGTS
jgi:predicted nucleotide-binding protein